MYRKKKVELLQGEIGTLQESDDQSEQQEALESPTEVELPWNIELLGAELAWSEGLTGEGVKVAIIDTGVSPHLDLNMTDRSSVMVDNPATPENEASPDDDNGHGTHLAGILGAQAGNGTVNSDGVHIDVVGVAPNVSYILSKQLIRMATE